jgi:hypothetical protein
MRGLVKQFKDHNSPGSFDKCGTKVVISVMFSTVVPPFSSSINSEVVNISVEPSLTLFITEVELADKESVVCVGTFTAIAVGSTVDGVLMMLTLVAIDFVEPVVTRFSPTTGDVSEIFDVVVLSVSVVDVAVGWSENKFERKIQFFGELNGSELRSKNKTSQTFSEIPEGTKQNTR